jgi:hypothetical protein
LKKSAGKIVVDRIAEREEHSSSCPWCGHALLRTLPHGFDVPGRKTWLRDGDTILGVWESLTEEQKNRNAYDFHLFVGDCPSCKKDYYTIETGFIDAEKTEELDEFLNHNVPGMEDLVSNFLCTLVDGQEGLPRQWTMEEYRTPEGPMHKHMFGPFRLDSPEEIIHPEYGVMACTGGEADPWKHGGFLILALFDDLRNIVRETRKEWDDKEITDLIEDFETMEPQIETEKENAPIFFAGPDGGPSVSPDWSEAVSKFSETVRKILGPNPSGTIWPYRHAGSMFLAVDLKGDKGEVNMTIYECGADPPFIPVFSGKEDSNWECEPTVTDAVDAFYLVSSLMKHLEIPGTPIWVF